MSRSATVIVYTGDDIYWTPTQAARLLRTSTAKVLKLVHGPLLDAYQFGKRLRISSEQLERYQRAVSK